MNMPIKTPAMPAKPGAPALRPRVHGPEDHEFLPAALEILQTPPSPRRLMFLWVLCAMLVAALLWSFIARLDIYAVATGRVQPSGRSKVVQPLETGKVKAIHVENGRQVKAGDLLIELDPTESDAELDAAKAELESYRAEAARRRAEINAVQNGLTTLPEVDFPGGVGEAVRHRENAVLASELKHYFSQVETLRAQLQEKAALSTRLESTIAARERLIAVLRERMDMRETLVAKSAGTRAAVLDAQQVLEQELTNIAYDKGQLVEVSAAIASIERQIDLQGRQLIADQAGKLAEAERKRDRLAQDVVKAAAKAERTRLFAPIDGTVQQLAVTTLGQVVTTGQPLLVLVPKNPIVEVEAQVTNKDVGFLQIGQEAVVKVDAFPFTRYGTVAGKVVRISREAVDSRELEGGDASTVGRNQNASSTQATQRTQDLVYPVTIEIKNPFLTVDGKDTPLTPGMTVVVDIRTGDRRVIDFLLSPISEAASGAGHER